MIKRKSFCIFLTLLFLSPISFISAGELAISISPNNPSLSLNHGQLKQISFSISNDNSVCSISCNWAMLENNQNEVDSGTFTSSAGSSKTLSLSFKAPTKSEAKQDSGTIEYVLGVECMEASSWNCWTNGEDLDTTTIALNYDLTFEEKNAKTYLSIYLVKMLSDLQLFESKSYNLDSKLNSYPSNVLISDLENSLSNYESSYNSLKSNYDSVKSLYESLEYLSAKSNFQENWMNQLSNLNIQLNTLEGDIEKRLKRHNEIVELINELKKSFSELKIKSEVAEVDVSSLRSNINSLVDNFESGSFNSYEVIENSVGNLASQVSDLEDNLESQFGNIVNEGNSLLEKENVKLGLTQQLSYASAESVGSLSTLCNSFDSIKSLFQDYNNNLTSSYNAKLKKVQDYNLNIDSINDKLSLIISLRNNVSKMVNENGITELNELPCQEELEIIAELEDFSNFNEAYYDECLILQTKLSEAKNEKEGLLFNLMSFFRKLWFKSFKFQKISLAEELSLPEEPELIKLEDNSKSFAEKYCSLDLTIETNSISPVSNIRGDTLGSSNVGGVIEKDNQCCAFGVCQTCCENDACKNDVNSYPVIFLHGHSFEESDSPEYSLDAFNDMQLALYQDKYRFGGTFLPSQSYSDMVQGEWGKVNFPISVKATYYYGAYNNEGQLISAPSKQESISTYAQRLKNIVDLVKYRTGRDKVNIIAHSMGGLVARDYIKNQGGDSSVYKLIMIGTPNHGIYGNVDSFCEIFGANTECAQMEADSAFITNLNSGDETYGGVKYYTIAGSGCVLSNIDGDGIVRVTSVQLEGSNNVIVNGECEGFFSRDFHSNILDTSKYPETLEYIKQFLS